MGNFQKAIPAVADLLTFLRSVKNCALLLPLVFLSSCFDSSQDPIPFNTANYAPDLKPGDSRLYVKEFKSSGSRDSGDLFSLGLFTVSKDTLFHGDTGRIVNVKVWDFYPDSNPYPDSTFIWNARELVVKEGSDLSIYLFKNGSYPFLVDLFKTGVIDTSAFSDREIVEQYPLTLNKPWQIRLIGDMTGSIPLSKEYLGLQTLDILGESYSCGTFVQRTLDDTTVIKSWVASTGLVKAEVDYKDQIPYGGDGEIFHWKESYELIDMNPSDSTIEKFKAIYKAKTWLSVSP